MLLPPTQSYSSRIIALQNVSYLITFSGSYYVNNSADVKSFEPVTLEMDQAMVNEGPLSVFKNEYAPVVFPKIYPDFKMLHKYRVDSTVRKDGQPVVDLNLMNRGEITSVIVRENLPIKVALYKNVDDLREAVWRYIADQQGFAREQDFKQRTQGATAKVASRFQEMNAEQFDLVKKAQEAELQNKIVHQPTLFDILATKNAIDSMKSGDALLHSEVNTTGFANQQAMAGHTVNGYIENADLDEFLDGVPTINGKPIKNPKGTVAPPPRDTRTNGF